MTSYEVDPKVTFQTLVPEIQIYIFNLLDPITSTCLGLTCRNFYALHRRSYSKVEITQWELMGKKRYQARLHFFLRDWMWNSGKLVWGGKYNVKKFIPLERETLEKEYIVHLRGDYDSLALRHPELTTKALKRLRAREWDRILGDIERLERREEAELYLIRRLGQIDHSIG